MSIPLLLHAMFLDLSDAAASWVAHIAGT
jgi:hypothetical protein